MSYEKQTWQTGDTVTSAKLNHMEDGIASAGGGGMFFVELSYDGTSYTLDKSYNEITAAIQGGSSVVIQANLPSGYVYYPLLIIGKRGVSYVAQVFDIQSDDYLMSLEADTADGVLTYTP